MTGGFSVAQAAVLGEILRRLRRVRGLRLSDIEGMAGISQSSLSRIERGKKDATVVQLRRIAQAIGAKPHLILRDSQTMEEVLEKQLPGLVVERDPRPPVIDGATIRAYVDRHYLMSEDDMVAPS